MGLPVCYGQVPGSSLDSTGVMTTAFVTASNWSRKHKVENQPGQRGGMKTRRDEKQQPAINQIVKCVNG